MKVLMRCSSCEGYGIWREVEGDKKGNSSICPDCGGSGSEVEEIPGKPFSKRLILKGIRFVQVSVDTDGWVEDVAQRGQVTYKQFLRGKRPTLKRAPPRKLNP